MKQTIAVIGQGFVGGSITTVFSERGFDVCVYDKTGKVSTGGRQPLTKETLHPCNTREFVEACETNPDFSKIYFVCLPTPMYDDGSADLSIVEGVLADLASIPGDRIAVVKSTIPPGSTEKWNQKFNSQGLHVIFNPEFLTEANALNDMRNQDRIILGGPRPWINDVKHIFETAFSNVPIIKTSSTTAEMVKYVTNIHLAVKVSLANEFYQICNALDNNGLNIDYDKVIEYATLDKRLGTSHWKVPGPMPDDITGKPAFGFAGSCVTENCDVLVDDNTQINIKDFVNQFNVTGTNTLVSTNDQLSTLETKNVEKISVRDYDGIVYKFTVGSKTITTTPEHFFPVKRKEKLILIRACDINDDDELYVIE